MRLHRFAVLAAALLFSTGGVAIKGVALSGWQVASIRSGVAALFLLLLLPAARRGWSWRALAVGFAYASTLVLFVLANKLTTAANTIFLQSTAPLYILLLGPRLLGERFAPRDLFPMGLIAIGLALFFVDSGAESTTTASDPRLGNLLAACAGLSWAFTLMGLRWMQHPGSEGNQGAAVKTLVVGNLLACALCAPFSFPLAPGPGEWVILVYLGAVQIGCAYLLLTYGMRGVTAFEGSLLILAEPALNPIWTWLVLGEQVRPLALCGGGLILFASTFKSFLSQRARG
jgi:drug/metabolite transporter (DMT)-like permease